MDKYKNLISSIADILKKEDFFKKGNSFYIKKKDNWGILSFQKSINSILNEVIFTINIGVSFKKLRKFNNEDLKKQPELEKSHWIKRVGFLLPEKKDY